MLIYCFSEMCCYWSSCWGLLQSFLETVLTALCFWQIHGQGLHSPKEAEESWVMMAQTFCYLDRSQQSLSLVAQRIRKWRMQCVSAEDSLSILPHSVGRYWYTSSPPWLYLAIQDLSKCFAITFSLLLSATAKQVWHLLLTSLTALTHTSHRDSDHYLSRISWHHIVHDSVWVVNIHLHL